jgi:hypothetical protein
MIAVLFVGIACVLGMACGGILSVLRFNVFALLPGILLVTVGAIVLVVAAGQDLWVIVLGSVAAVVSVQVGLFFIGCLHVRLISRGPKLLGTVQAAIGQELKIFFAAPQELPPEMLTLLRRLDEQDAALPSQLGVIRRPPLPR